MTKPIFRLISYNEIPLTSARTDSILNRLYKQYHNMQWGWTRAFLRKRWFSIPISNSVKSSSLIQVYSNSRPVTVCFAAQPCWWNHKLTQDCDVTIIETWQPQTSTRFYNQDSAVSTLYTLVLLAAHSMKLNTYKGDVSNGQGFSCSSCYELRYSWRSCWCSYPGSV